MCTENGKVLEKPVPETFWSHLEMSYSYATEYGKALDVDYLYIKTKK